MSVLSQLREELNAKAKAISDVLAPYEDADMPAETYAQVLTMTSELRALKDKFKAAQDGADTRSEVAELLKYLNDPTGGVRHPGATGEPIARRGVGKSMGRQVTESPDWVAFMRSIAPNGKVADGTRFQSPPAPVDSKLLLGRKDLVTGGSATSAGALIVNDFQPELLSVGRRPLNIRDVITVGQTNSDMVEYVRVTSETNNAAPVAEATTVADGAKPESALAMEAVTAPVKTIAHWIPATRRALSDAAQIRTYIDEFLTFGLEEELEDQMIDGDGTGQNFVGLLHTSGTQTQDWDTDLITTTRKARTKVRTVGRAVPTAYLFNPADWESIDLTQDAEQRYYFGGPMQLGTPRLWGLPVVESEAVPAGTGIVGDTRQMVLWDREDAQIYVSDSHADFFVRNIIVILAELRAAFGVLRPAAFVEIDLTAL
jgi:HK97 family phage major capsid protein